MKTNSFQLNVDINKSVLKNEEECKKFSWRDRLKLSGFNNELMKSSIRFFPLHHFVFEFLLSINSSVLTWWKFIVLNENIPRKLWKLKIKGVFIWIMSIYCEILTTYQKVIEVLMWLQENVVERVIKYPVFEFVSWFWVSDKYVQPFLS